MTEDKDITTVRIHRQVLKQLERYREYRRESYEDIIKRIIKEGENETK